jgi:hypothetical protein
LFSERLQLRFGDAAARGHDRKGFESSSYLADIAYFAGGKGTNDGTAIRLHDQDPHPGQGANRFSDRGLADLEFAGEPIGDQSIAGQESATEDLLEDPFDDSDTAGACLALFRRIAIFSQRLGFHNFTFLGFSLDCI